MDAAARKLHKKREQGRKRQSFYREKQADKGLVPVQGSILKTAHMAATKAKGSLTLDAFVTEAINHQYDKELTQPPVPQSPEEAGIQKVSVFVPEETKDKLLNRDFKEGERTLAAIIYSHALTKLV